MFRLDTMFSPGETYEALQSFIKDIELSDNVKIHLDMNKNVFSFENGSLRYLELVKKKTQLDSELVSSYNDSWKISFDNYQKLIAYVKTLTPFNADQIININEWAQIFNEKIAKLAVKGVLKTIEMSIKFPNKKSSINEENFYDFVLEKDKIISSKYEILHDCAQISATIKNQSISLFNDNFEAYMDELIKQKTYEHASLPSNRSNIVIELLRAALEEYRKIQKETGSIKNTFDKRKDYFNDTAS